MAADPLVSVVTPVYNGERYVRQCVESVLAQTYRNWECIIVDNRSTDRSPAIAAEYAGRDRRIRVHTNETCVGVTQNHNIAFGLMSAESQYCKVVHADDWLFPECLARMVEVAEAHPAVGLVGSYTLRDAEVKGDGLPYPSTVIAGRELCRLTLREDACVFWSPSCLLIRSDLVRARGDEFYRGNHLHADDEAYFEALQHSDFGFVHQVLTFVRTHGESVSASYPERVNAYLPASLELLIRYGPGCMGAGEYRDLLGRRVREYYRFLGRSIVRWKDREFWQFHAGRLASLGYPFSRTRVVGACAAEALRILWRPGEAAGRALAAFREQRGSGAA